MEMSFHQLSTMEQLDELAIGAGIQVLPDPPRRPRIQGFGDLDVEVSVHLHRVNIGTS